MADFTWAEGPGSRYSIGIKSSVPIKVSGKVSRASATFSPISSKGCNTRPMGRLLERFIAGEGGGHLVARDRAHHQPGPGSRIAEVERGFGRRAARPRRGPSQTIRGARLRTLAPS